MSITDLITYQDAGKNLDLSYWQLKRRVSKGQIEAVKLPNGHSALTRVSVERYAAQQNKRGASAKTRRLDTVSLADSAAGSAT